MKLQPFHDCLRDSVCNDFLAFRAVEVVPVEGVKECPEAMVVRTRLADVVDRFIMTVHSFVAGVQSVCVSSADFNQGIVRQEVVFCHCLGKFCARLREFSLKLQDESVPFCDLRRDFHDVIFDCFAFDGLPDFVKDFYGSAGCGNEGGDGCCGDGSHSGASGGLVVCVNGSTTERGE